MGNSLASAAGSGGGGGGSGRSRAGYLGLSNPAEDADAEDTKRPNEESVELRTILNRASVTTMKRLQGKECNRGGRERRRRVRERDAGPSPVGLHGVSSTERLAATERKQGSNHNFGVEEQGNGDVEGVVVHVPSTAAPSSSSSFSSAPVSFSTTSSFFNSLFQQERKPPHSAPPPHAAGASIPSLELGATSAPGPTSASDADAHGTRRSSPLTSSAGVAEGDVHPKRGTLDETAASGDEMCEVYRRVYSTVRSGRFGTPKGLRSRKSVSPPPLHSPMDDTGGGGRSNTPRQAAKQQGYETATDDEFYYYDENGEIEDGDEDDDYGESVVYLPRWAIDPHGRFYVHLNALALAFAVVAGVVEPYAVAFLDPQKWLSPATVVVYASDVVALTHMASNFFAAHFDAAHGEWTVQPVQIAAAYLRGWFWYDALAAVPWDVLLRLACWPCTSGPSAALATSSVGLLRVLRLRRLWEFLWSAGLDFHYNYFTVCIQKFAFLILFAAHWAACVFFLLARVYDFAEFTWVGRCEPSLQLSPPLEAYVTSLYWAVTTLSSTGYGDLSAFTVAERLWTAAFMIANLAITAYVLGNMTVLLTKADSHLAAYRDRIAAINSYMGAHRVPSSLQQQVQAHLKLHYETASVRDDVLRHCPANVRMRVARHVYRHFLNMPPIFHNTSDVFKDQLTAHCREDFFLPQVELLSAGDPIADLYIIAAGRMRAYVRTPCGLDEPWLDFREGDCVGEYAFLCEGTQLWSVKTTAVCRVLCISRDDYRKMARNHPADDRQVIANLLQASRQLAQQSTAMVSTAAVPAKAAADSLLLSPSSDGRAAAAERRTWAWVVADMTQLLKHEVEAFRSSALQQTVTDLCYAAKRGDVLELFRLATGGFDVNQHDYDGRTPLHIAAAHGQDAAVQFLLANGAHANAGDAFGRTPLLEAVSAGHSSTATLIQRNGGELALRDEAVHLCQLASRGDAVQLERLLSHGADANARDYDGRTPLHVAAAESHLSVVKVLVQYGAEPNSQDRWRRTPLDEAQSRSTNGIAEFLATCGPTKEHSATNDGEPGNRMQWETREGQEPRIGSHQQMQVEQLCAPSQGTSPPLQGELRKEKGSSFPSPGLNTNVRVNCQRKSEDD